MTEKTPHKNSFFHEKPLICPVCETEFKKEVMRFGHGRLISLDINNELKQIYKFSKKYGEIYPYIYNVAICPECWFATLTEDFSKKGLYDIENLKSETKLRIKKGRELYAQADFTLHRTLKTGLTGYFLAILCYTQCKYESFASAKKAISAIRASWCADELSDQFPDSHFQVLKQYFRYITYIESVKHLENIYTNKSKEQIAVELYGPDVNKDMGFDGFLYLSSYLNLEFLSLEPLAFNQHKRLVNSRNTLSKVFGFGKSSKQKPSILMDKAKDLYNNIKDGIEKLESENDFTLQEEKTKEVVVGNSD